MYSTHWSLAWIEEQWGGVFCVGWYIAGYLKQWTLAALVFLFSMTNNTTHQVQRVLYDSHFKSLSSIGLGYLGGKRTLTVRAGIDHPGWNSDHFRLLWLMLMQ